MRESPAGRQWISQSFASSYRGKFNFIRKTWPRAQLTESVPELTLFFAVIVDIDTRNSRSYDNDAYASTDAVSFFLKEQKEDCHDILRNVAPVRKKKNVLVSSIALTSFTHVEAQIANIYFDTCNDISTCAFFLFISLVRKFGQFDVLPVDCFTVAFSGYGWSVTNDAKCVLGKYLVWSNF